MAFDGTEGAEITLSSAAQMTKNYRSENPHDTLAHFFGKDILNRILDQEGCVGIRFYYGLETNGIKQIVIVGVDRDENDLTNLVADMSFPCPNACSAPNPLNS